MNADFDGDEMNLRPWYIWSLVSSVHEPFWTQVEIAKWISQVDFILSQTHQIHWFPICGLIVEYAQPTLLISEFKRGDKSENFPSWFRISGEWFVYPEKKLLGPIPRGMGYIDEDLVLQSDNSWKPCQLGGTFTSAIQTFVAHPRPTLALIESTLEGVLPTLNAQLWNERMLQIPKMFPTQDDRKSAVRELLAIESAWDKLFFGSKHIGSFDGD